MREVVIGRVSEFPESGRQVVAVDDTEIGVFRVNGGFTAFENVCPHLGGPVCQGKVIARVQEVIADDKTSLGLAFSKDHTNVACPWHGYEFDVETGRHQGNSRFKLRPVKIDVVDGSLVVTVPERTRERIARARPAGSSNVVAGESGAGRSAGSSNIVAGESGAGRSAGGRTSG